MGQTDFEFGYNEPGNRDYHTDDPPMYSSSCMGMMVCPHCGRSVICGDVTTNGHKFKQENNNNMADLGSFKGQGGSSRLPWLDGEAVPEKGATLKIDAARLPRKKSNVVVFLDVTMNGDKKKRFTWSIRKGFTLDAIFETLESTDTDEWVGKTLKVVKGGDDGQYVNIATQ